MSAPRHVPGHLDHLIQWEPDNIDAHAKDICLQRLQYRLLLEKYQQAAENESAVANNLRNELVALAQMILLDGTVGDGARKLGDWCEHCQRSMDVQRTYGL